MDLDRHGAVAAVTVAPLGPQIVGRYGRLEEREHRLSHSGPVREAVRADLESVFRRDYPVVVGVATRVLGSRSEAEDVAQDVFLSFGRSTVPASDARGWLCVAAAHTALNRIRSGRRRAAREERVGTATARTVGDVADVVVDEEDRHRVRAALARLPRPQAITLVLRHSGMSYAEVAAALDLAPTSIGTTLRRAEQALGKELDRHAPRD